MTASRRNQLMGIFPVPHSSHTLKRYGLAALYWLHAFDERAGAHSGSTRNSGIWRKAIHINRRPKIPVPLPQRSALLVRQDVALRLRL